MRIFMKSTTTFGVTSINSPKCVYKLLFTPATMNGTNSATNEMLDYIDIKPNNF